MRSRFLLAAVLALGLAAVGRAAPAPAGGKSHGPPIVFQVAPIDKLLADARGMVTAVAGKGVVGMMDGAIKGKLGDKGWAGLDTKKPFAGYINLPSKAIKGPEDFKEFSAVLAIPMTKEDEFKDLFNRVGAVNPVKFHPVKGNDGLFAVYPGDEDPGQPAVRCRFHNGYAYLGVNAKDEQLDANALPAVADLVKANDPGLVLVRFLMDRYPEELIKQSQGQLDDALDKLKNAPPDGAMRMTWLAGILESYAAMAKKMTATMKDTEESGFRVLFDEKAAEVAFESYAVPKKNTAYAKELADVKPTQNRFASLITDKSPAGALLSFPTTSPELRDLIQKGIDVGLKAKEDAPPPARPIIEELLKGLGRTIKGDSFDIGAAITAGKDGHYTAVAALTFADASGLEKALKDALKDAPQDVQDMIKLDAEKIEGVNVHRVSLPKADEKAQKLLGSTDLLVAFGSKGIYAAIGTGASDAIKAAMTAKPAAAKTLDVVVNPKLLGEMVTTGEEQAGKMFAQMMGTEDKRISAFYVSYEGGKAMTSRVGVSLKVLPKMMMGFYTVKSGEALPVKPD